MWLTPLGSLGLSCKYFGTQQDTTWQRVFPPKKPHTVSPNGPRKEETRVPHSGRVLELPPLCHRTRRKVNGEVIRILPSPSRITKGVEGGGRGWNCLNYNYWSLERIPSRDAWPPALQVEEALDSLPTQSQEQHEEQKEPPSAWQGETGGGHLFLQLLPQQKNNNHPFQES